MTLAEPNACTPSVIVNSELYARLEPCPVLGPDGHDTSRPILSWACDLEAHAEIIGYFLQRLPQDLGQELGRDMGQDRQCT